MAVETFGSRLAEQRRANGYSQKQAATDLGVSQALLSHYENGVREPGLTFVVKAAEYYGVSCDYLLGKTSNEALIKSGPKIVDLPEDERWSVETILRAALAVSGYGINDKDLKQYLKTAYSLATYFVVFASVKRGYLPKSWLGKNSLNPKQLNFLISSFAEEVEKIEPRVTNPRRVRVPKSMETITTWVNDFLNLRIAEIL